MELLLMTLSQDSIKLLIMIYLATKTLNTWSIQSKKLANFDELTAELMHANFIKKVANTFFITKLGRQKAEEFILLS